MQLRRAIGAACAAVLLSTTVAAAEPAAPAEAAGDRVDLYTAELDAGAVRELRVAGFDVVDVREVDGDAGRVEVEVAATSAQVEAFDLASSTLELKRNAEGATTAEAATQRAANGFDVWRSNSEEGGLEDQTRELVEAHPDIAELKVIGQSVQGTDILAVRVTADVASVAEGERPQVLSSSLQHAREWIVGETNIRLLRHMLTQYGSNSTVDRVVDNTELWFVIVANPDGYDWTFEDGQRLWRKNLADNDGDGEITGADGVDLNRNFPTNWGYDNEGSSPEPTSQVYRGTAPASEPETQALDALMAEQDFVFQLNWHSAAELLLYGIGWQVATPSPDDLIHIAVNGTDDNPAVAGYDPDISAELYTTNGDTTDHAAEEHGILSYTPELDTCDAAEDIFPDDAFGDDYCESEGRSVFEFPDDERLIEAVFRKNLPYALSAALSAGNPYDPKTKRTTDLTPPTYQVDTFDVSHGSDQEVAVVARRDLTNLKMHWKTNGKDRQVTETVEWEGGEVYGATNNVWYAEYRGLVTGAEPGDTIKVWFTGQLPAEGPSTPARYVRSERFTYDVEVASDASVLVVAEEDYEGFAPEQDADAPLYADAHVAALAANGIDAEVWDVTAQGVPHDLGVLSHYDAVVWELGENRLTQEAGDVETETPNGPIEDLSVAESRQFLTIAVRDYLNEGGKLVHAGAYANYFGTFGSALGGAYYGLNGDETADCEITTSFFDNCLIWSDDFAQYYLGVSGRSDVEAPAGVVGTAAPVEGLEADLAPGTTPVAGGFTVTSNVLPVEDFPQFASTGVAEYLSDGADPFAPLTGEQYAAAVHSDGAWMRLTRTVDLTDAEVASLDAQASLDLEAGYDNLLVEVRPVGTEDWTTLPEANGLSSDAPPTECSAGFYAEQHPALLRYLTIADPCETSGTSGEWNALTGSTGGWVGVQFDLTGYVGSEVEVSVSYVTDPGTGGRGVFLDDVELTVDDETETQGFEDGLAPWTVPGAPEGSPGNATDWIASGPVFEPPSAVVATEDTVTFGFGLEDIATDEARAAMLGAAIEALLATP